MAIGNAVERAKAAAAEAWVGSLQRQASALESPIEEAMFWGLLACMRSAGGRVVSRGDYPEDLIYGVEVPGRTDRGEVVILKPQLQVGRFRVDLAVVRLCHVDAPTVAGGVVRVAVECDGHDFHERTKEQAEHDKARDRDLQAAGWVVARFTGSEIFRDPVRAAEKVFELLHQVVDRRGA